jgi:hypothetical protein
MSRSPYEDENELPFAQRAAKAVPTNLLADIVADNRKPRLPSSPIAKTGGSGWVDPPQVRDWRPPGQRVIDQLIDAADDAERKRRLGK